MASERYLTVLFEHRIFDAQLLDKDNGFFAFAEAVNKKWQEI